MSSNNYDQLENEIGGAGALSTDNTSPKAPLGKIRVPGQLPELDNNEKTEMENFLNKGRARRAAAQVEVPQVSIEDGWIPIDRAEMGVRSKFYPESWEFFVRAATVQSIRNWVAIDESNAIQVNRVMNEIIRSNVRIDTNDVHPAGWQSINSWDRFWFILKVREATFVSGDYKIEFEDTCAECDADLTYTLDAQSLGFEAPDEEVMQYWNGKTWVIDPSEYNVEADEIELFLPTIGKDESIITWAQYKAQNNEKIDENFITYLPWMMDKPIKELDRLDSKINHLFKKYKRWSLDYAELMEMIIRNIIVTPSDKLTQVCPHCKQEVQSSVRFPDGIKRLFRVESKVKTFGSK